MARMKTFGIYALIIIVFYIFSNLLINVGMKSIYKNITDQEINIENPNIEIKEAKATYVNGYVEGTMTNNSDSRIDNKYIKLDVYSKRGVLLETKYIDVNNLEPNASRDFRMAFKAKEAYKYVMTLTDNIEGVEDIRFFSEEVTKRWIIKALLLTAFFY